MAAVLGIDAAWTPHNPSGIALVRQSSCGGWECICVSHSYELFLANAGRPTPTEPQEIIAAVLEVASVLAEQPIHLVAADIPLSKIPITCRRKADNLVSQKFGSRGCAAHSPIKTRPGPIGEALFNACADAGYTLATDPQGLNTPALIEVYPHPALLALMGKDYRLPYKTGKTRTYWPGKDIAERIYELRAVMDGILTRLKLQFAGIPLAECPECPTLRGLKQTEDQIDALICCWTGVLAIEGEAVALGDQDAAIWVPKESIKVSGRLAVGHA